MKTYILTFFIAFSFFLSELKALHRDFENNFSDEYPTYFCHNCVKSPFKWFGKKEIWKDLPLYTSLIPTCKERWCEKCAIFFKKKNEGIYAPYLYSNDYFDFFKDHLLYCADNMKCQCYWPEISDDAAKISDLAYELFSDLFKKTKLSVIVKDANEQKLVLSSKPWGALKFSNRGVVIAFISKAFLYSHYHRICKDLDQYSKLKFDDRDYFVIQDKLENIQETLGKLYLKLYESCLSKHANDLIKKEKIFVSQLFNTYDDLTSLEHELSSVQADVIHKDKWGIQAHALFDLDNSGSFDYLDYSLSHDKESRENRHKPVEPNTWIASEILLRDGSVLNNLLLYQDAIKVLTKAIKLNPSNKEAYIERAMSYFETNQLSQALQDYEAAKQLSVIPPFKLNIHKAMMRGALYVPEHKIEFSQGLILGTFEGAQVSVIEFIPSTLSSCRGILHGLWAFVCSPLEVSQEMINTAYAIGEFISLHSTEECLHCVVPELRELSLNWHTLNDHYRGQKIGYIIGKYGVDIFAPIAAFNGASKVIALKRANTMLTLESCVASQIKQAKILEESAKRALLRTTVIESAKKGKILVKTENVCHHIIQDHHHWEKVIKLTGDKKEDFKMILKLIEDNNIVSKVNIKDTFKHKNLPISVTEYGMKVNGHEVRVFMENYIEKGETFLKNAYVQTP